MEISIKEITHFLNLVRQKELISKNEQVAYPFNLILSSSDFYYRENFHSDIICSIFNQKPLFVKEFIVFIQSCKTSLNIDLSNYNKPYALRETDKIDILIKDKKSNHCIIIENKINPKGLFCFVISLSVFFFIFLLLFLFIFSFKFYSI